MRRVLLVASALLLLAGCRVDVGVEVDAEADGTGRVEAVVTLDAAAAERVPDLADQLAVDDLTAAGWAVEGPQPTEDGGVRVEASKGFRSPQEAAQVVEELSGPNGPFRDFRLSRTRSFLKTRTSFEGAVDLSGGIEAFSDEGLRRRFGGSALGFDRAELERRLGTTFDRIFGFRVAARLPGEVASNAPGGDAVWEPQLGQSITLSATSEEWNTRNIGAAAVSALSALALAVVVAQRLRHRR